MREFVHRTGMERQRGSDLFWAGLDAETAMRDRDPKFRRLYAATQNSETNKWRLSNGEVSLTMWRFSNGVVLL